MSSLQKPAVTVEQLDRRIAIKETAALFIAGLGASIAFLGYESDIRIVTGVGVLVLLEGLVVEASASDDRHTRSEYIRDGVEQLIQYSYSQDSVD